MESSVGGVNVMIHELLRLLITDRIRPSGDRLQRKMELSIYPGKADRSALG